MADKLAIAKGFATTPTGQPQKPPTARKRTKGTQQADKLKRTLKRRHNTICGLDVSSSRVAIVALTDPVRVYKFDLPKPWSPMVCAMAEGLAVAFIAGLQNELDWDMDVWIEEPVIGKGGARSTIVQAFVSGAIQAGLYGIGSRITLINNQSWKKEAIGNGNASKDLVASTIRQRWPHQYEAACDGADQPDQDLLDAFGVANAGAARRGFVDAKRPMPEVRRLVLRPRVQQPVSSDKG